MRQKIVTTPGDNAFYTKRALDETELRRIRKEYWGRQHTYWARQAEKEARDEPR